MLKRINSLMGIMGKGRGTYKFSQQEGENESGTMIDAPKEELMPSKKCDKKRAGLLNWLSSEGAPAEAWMTVPLLGRHSLRHHVRILYLLLGASLISLILTIVYALYKSEAVSRQLSATDQAMMQSQRLAKSATLALMGDAAAFKDLQQSSQILELAVNGLEGGSSKLNLRALDSSYSELLTELKPKAENSINNAKQILEKKQLLLQVNATSKNIGAQAAEQGKLAEKLSASKMVQRAGAEEIAAANRLVVLTGRVDKLSSEFLSFDGVNPASMLTLGNDLNVYKEIVTGMLNGNPDMHLPATRDEATRDMLIALNKQYDQMRSQVGVLMASLTSLVTVRGAQEGILTENEALRNALEKLQGKLVANSGIGSGTFILMLVLAILSFGGAMGLSYTQLKESRRRQDKAEYDAQEAIDKEREVTRINTANQAAILRLMNELQAVAEGDLTQETTVTEDITGAIADSINLTIEELRDLVIQVKDATVRLVSTTDSVNQTSDQLLQLSHVQMLEIRETENDILHISSRVSSVSQDAQEAATVARASLQSATKGLEAVQSAIGGMNNIRSQIQDTSKRIKRLGESSQEIGEIIELIADITEQTNVLALNAAIQASSAGEAGRGFSVVAEEVQRLAIRSGEATKQISTLVKAIQTDTQDAIFAMEMSTQGVIEGAKLSDNAGAALSEIDKSSRKVTERVEQISSSTLQEASAFQQLAQRIQHISSGTEKTTTNTKLTAEQVKKLEQMAKVLNHSIERFKIQKNAVEA